MEGLASRLHISREQLLQIHRYCEPDDAKSLFWLFLDAFIFGASYRIAALHFTLTLPMIIVAGSRVKEPLGNEPQKSTQSCNLLEMNNHSAFEAGLA